MNRWSILALTGLFTLACAGGKDPTITIVAPAPGARVTGTVEIRVEVEGDKDADWLATPGAWADDPSDVVYWDTTTEPSGPRTLEVGLYGKDDAWITDSIEVYVDHPMNVTLATDPPTTGAVGGEVRFVVGYPGTDTLVEALVSIDDVVFDSLTDYPYVTRAWDTRVGVADGRHTVSATVTRQDGEQATVSIPLETSNCEVVPFDATFVDDLGAAPDGAIYFTEQGVLSRWTPEGGTDSGWVTLEDQVVLLVEVLSDGTVIVATQELYGGPSHLHEVDTVTGALTGIPGPLADVWHLASGPEGRLYAMDVSELHLWTRAGGWTLAAPSIATWVAPFVDSAGFLWTTTSTTMYRHTLDGQGVVVLSEEVDFNGAGNTVRAFGEDDEGRLLVLLGNHAYQPTGLGIQRLDPELLATRGFGVAVLDLLPYADGVAREHMAFTHLTHRPGCHAILAAGHDLNVIEPPAIVPSDMPGRP